DGLGDVDRDAGLLCCGDHVCSPAPAWECDNAIWLEGEHVPVPQWAGALAVVLPFGSAAGEGDAIPDRPFPSPAISALCFALDHFDDSAQRVDLVQHLKDVLAVGV